MASVLPSKYTRKRSTATRKSVVEGKHWDWRKWFRKYFGFRSVRYLLLQIFLLVVILVVVWLLIYMTKIESYSCQTQYGDCPEELDAYLEKQVPGNLFGLVWYSYTRLPDNFGYIVKPGVSLEWKKINYLFYVEEPVVTITSETQLAQGRYYVSGFDGQILTETAELRPPVLYLPAVAYLPGQQVSVTDQQAVKIVYYLASLGYQFEARVVDDVLNVGMQLDGKQIVVVFPLSVHRSPEKLVSTLQIILTQATIEPEQVQIDMRYEKPTLIDLSAPVIEETEFLEASESGQPNANQ